MGIFACGEKRSILNPPAFESHLVAGTQDSPELLFVLINHGVNGEVPEGNSIQTLERY
jgi:hypothetical protein